MCGAAEWIINIIHTCRLFPKYLLHTIKIFFRASWYTYSVSLTMYVCTRSHCTYQTGLSVNLHYDEAKFHMRLARHSTVEQIAIHREQTRSVLRRWSIENTLIGMEPESIPFYTSNDTGRSKTISAIPDWSIFITVKIKGVVNRPGKKVLKVLH